MTNLQTQGLATMARAVSVTAETLLTLQKSIANVMDSDSDMDILVHNDEKITDRQKNFITTLVRKNCLDPGERENKLAEMESYSRQDADMAIKALLGEN